MWNLILIYFIETDVHQYHDPTIQDKTDALVVCLLSWLVGICGIHRFYQGKILTGFIWLLTCGLCGIGAFVDAIINTVNCVKAFTAKD